MPHFDVFLLPLLGGYWLITQFNFTRYNAKRSEGYRIVILSSIAGVILFFFATLLAFFLLKYQKGIALANNWHSIFPYPNSGKSALSFILGPAFAHSLNFIGRWVSFLSESAAVEREIETKKDPLEILLRKALGTQNCLVSITLSNNKVYIGVITSSFNPGNPCETISIIPKKSGHRRAEDQRLFLDLNYEDVLNRVKNDFFEKVKEEINSFKNVETVSEEEIFNRAMKNVKDRENPEKYEKIIPIKEIVAAGLFDPKVYDEYFLPVEKKREPGNITPQPPIQ